MRPFIAPESNYPLYSSTHKSSAYLYITLKIYDTLQLMNTTNETEEKNHLLCLHKPCLHTRAEAVRVWKREVDRRKSRTGAYTIFAVVVNFTSHLSQ